jgi:alpha-beta hydrolase superfamily lysophospholipase
MDQSSRPVFFGAPERACFAWIHTPSGQRRKSGVVICKPFGYEAICAHRSVRHIAERAARAGIPAIRFDYEGSGDSLGSDRDGDRLPAWIGSIHAAIDELKRDSGVERVYLLGLRLGSALATLASAERTDVAGLISIAPVVTVKTYLRELRALQMALALNPPPCDFQPPAGEREAAGFMISGATHASLSEIDVSHAPLRPAERVLILDREELPSGDKWAEAMRSAGVSVDHRSVQGFAELVLDPHNARVPDTIIEASVAFITQTPEEAGGPSSDVSRVSAADASGAARAEFEVDGQRVRESAVQLTGAHPLFGVVTEPAAPASAPRRTILLLNSGAIHHIGPNRLYVEFARSWAARGCVVMRADLSGLGDSPARPGEAENVVYSSRAQEDVAALVSYLRSREGVGKVYAVGLCSGAYNAFKAAVAGAPLDGVVLINPLTFFWKEGMSLNVSRHKVVEDAQRYSRMVRSREAWKRLLSGRVELRRVVEVVLRKGGGVVETYLRDAGRFLGYPLPEDLGVELESVARRGVAMKFVFASDEPGIELLRAQGGRSVQRLSEQGKLEQHLIPGADHTFTGRWMQEQLASELSRVVTRLPS